MGRVLGYQKKRKLNRFKTIAVVYCTSVYCACIRIVLATVDLFNIPISLLLRFIEYRLLLSGMLILV